MYNEKETPTGQGKGIEPGIRQDKGNKFSRQLQVIAESEVCNG